MVGQTRKAANKYSPFAIRLMTKLIHVTISTGIQPSLLSVHPFVLAVSTVYPSLLASN